MKCLRLILCAVAMLFCLHAQAETKSDYDHHYKLTGKQTWNFQAQENLINDVAGNNDFWEQQLRQDITQQLAARGFTKTTAPNLLVRYHLDTTERIETHYEYSGHPGHFTFGGWSLLSWQPGWHDTTQVRTPHINTTLVLEVVAAQSNQLIWRGYDTTAIDLVRTDQSIEKSVARLLNHFRHDIRASAA